MKKKKGVEKPEFRNLPIGEVGRGSNVRSSPWKAEDSAALVEDVRLRGILEPILVRPAPKGSKHGCPFEVVCGHRRLSAAAEAGLETIPAVVRRALSEADVIEMQIAENFQRRDLNGMEMARALWRLKGATGATERELSDRFGWYVGFASHYISLLRLPADAQDRVEKGTLALDAAFRLASASGRGDERVSDMARRLEGVPQEEARTILSREGFGGSRAADYDGGDAGVGFTQQGAASDSCRVCCDCCAVPWHDHTGFARLLEAKAKEEEKEAA